MKRHTVPYLGQPVRASIEVPGSKSHSNRVLVCAALAEGSSTVEPVAPGDDTVAMIDCLGRLGVPIGVDRATVTITGTGGALVDRPVTLSTRLAGTTSRFLTAVAALGHRPVTIDGEPPLRRRPMGPLHDALRQLGVEVRPEAEPGHVPVTVTGPPTGSHVSMRGDVSSQYVTALMLIGPILADGLVIELEGPLVSRPYVELTATVMEAFGATAEVGDTVISVPAGRYVGTVHRIEPDASSASYPLSLAAVLGGRVTVPGVTTTSRQGDARYAELLGLMGCSVLVDDTGTAVERDPDVALTGIDVDMADVSDLVPTLAVVAAFATTPTRIRGVGFIRSKESDRLGDLATELRRAGAMVHVTDDGLEIVPTPLRGVTLQTHHDHRLAMAFGVLGAAVEGTVVDDPDVVSKSWPGYWAMLDAVGS